MTLAPVMARDVEVQGRWSWHHGSQRVHPPRLLLSLMVEGASLSYCNSGVAECGVASDTIDISVLMGTAA